MPRGWRSRKVRSPSRRTPKQSAARPCSSWTGPTKRSAPSNRPSHSPPAADALTVESGATWGCSGRSRCAVSSTARWLWVSADWRSPVVRATPTWKHSTPPNLGLTHFYSGDWDQAQAIWSAASSSPGQDHPRCSRASRRPTSACCRAGAGRCGRRQRVCYDEAATSPDLQTFAFDGYLDARRGSSTCVQAILHRRSPGSSRGSHEESPTRIHDVMLLSTAAEACLALGDPDPRRRAGGAGAAAGRRDPQRDRRDRRPTTDRAVPYCCAARSARPARAWKRRWRERSAYPTRMPRVGLTSTSRRSPRPRATQRHSVPTSPRLGRSSAGWAPCSTGERPRGCWTRAEPVPSTPTDYPPTRASYSPRSRP